MEITASGEALLKEHNELFFELITIPEQRAMAYTINDENGHQVAKPRFKPSVYNWPLDLFTRLQSHMQTIWGFIETYSYWFDNSLKALIQYEGHKITKKSIVYLLQQNTSDIDEIYGDYDVERKLSKYFISYFRNNEKIKTFEPNVNTSAEIERWICLDTRKQIIDQFSFLWNNIQAEIESCMKEYHTTLPAELLTKEYITKKNNLIGDVIEEYPEFALFHLGKLAELYLVQILELEKHPKGINLVWEAQNKGLLTTARTKLLEDIRKEYNLLNHRLDYVTNKNLVIQYWKNFTNMLNN